MSLLPALIIAPLFAATFSSAVISAEKKLVKDEKNYALLQAAYLYNIAQFISWPEQQLNQPFRLCLFGKQTSNLQPHFAKAFEQRLLGQRKINVLPISTDMPLPDCHLIYLTSDAEIPPASITDNAEILRISAPEVSVSSSALFDLHIESGRIIIYYNSAAQTTFKLPINTALLRITKPRPGAKP